MERRPVPGARTNKGTMTGNGILRQLLELEFEVGKQHSSIAARLRLKLIFANCAGSIRQLESLTQGEV
ncbi:MAG: hypothetical protein WBP73_12655, partial [Terriglobales bacterium]